MKAFNVGRDDIVLDFFSGSASTGEAVARLNLASASHVHWILVQLPENLENNLRTAKGSSKKVTKNAIAYLKKKGKEPVLTELAEERLRITGSELAKEVAELNVQQKREEEARKLPDIGFRIFKLDDTGIEQPNDGQFLIDRIKPDRSDLDIIFEVMLKWGYELTYPIEKAEFAGYECYSVAAGDLICCMEPGLTVDALEAIAAEEPLPRRVFIMDSVFAGDDSLKLNALAIFKRVEEQTQQKIELRTV